MARFQFRCPVHNEYTTNKSPNNDELSHDKCPKCGKTSKRVYYPQTHLFAGMQAPGYCKETQAIRFRNNKARKGEAYAMATEKKFDESRKAR